MLRQGGSLALRALARHAQHQGSAAAFSSASAVAAAGSSSEARWGGALYVLAGAAASVLGAAGVVASADSGAPAPAAGTLKVTTPGGKSVNVLTPAGSQEWSVTITPARAPESGPPKPEPLAGPVQLKPTPYALSALEPHMSRETLEYHWGKHQRTYADNLNKQLASNASLAAVAESKGLEALVVAAWNSGRPSPAFNNAAQVYNHQLFWESMRPGGGGAPAEGGPLAAAIARDFPKGGLAQLQDEVRAAGTSQFGSGWAWLVCDDEGNLKVLKTANAVTPLVSGWHPLLCVDVWEHAYYIDFRNRRLDFINTFLAHLVDWGAAEERYKAVLASA